MIEEPGELGGTRSVDVVHMRQIEFDGTAAGQRGFNVRNRPRGSHGVCKIKLTHGDETRAVAVAVGADGNVHHLDPTGWPRG
jgi:hypothetical protein